MDEGRAYVKSSSDPAQVRRAERRALAKRDRFLGAVRASLQHPEVRLMIGELFEHVGLYRSTLDVSGSMMYFNEGRRSITQELRQACESADEAALALLEAEGRTRAKQDQRETDAAHMRRATHEGHV